MCTSPQSITAHPLNLTGSGHCTLSPGSGRLCTRGKQQRRALCAPTLRRFIHLSTHDKATAVLDMHLTPIDHSTHPQPHRIWPFSMPTGYFKISPSPTRWLCFSTCSTSLTQSCRGMLGKIAHVLLCDWSAIAYFRIPSFPQSCNFLPADADTSSWSG